MTDYIDFDYDTDLFDYSIYGGFNKKDKIRKLRCVGASKPNEKRPFVLKEGDIKNSFVSVIPDNATLVIPDIPVIEKPSLKLQEHFNSGDKSENLQFINLCMENGLFVNRASKYDTWFQMACAIKNTFGEDGYDVFTRFSKLCKKYDKYEFENKEIWDNLKCDGELTMGSIKYWAKMENENIYNQINVKLEKVLFDASGSLNMLLDIVNQSTDDETISTT